MSVERAEYDSEAEGEDGGVRREDEKKKRAQLKTTDCSRGEIPRFLRLQQRFGGDQFQRCTSNESATHARLSTPHTHSGITMFPLIFVKARNVSSLVTMKLRVTANGFDLTLLCHHS